MLPWMAYIVNDHHHQNNYYSCEGKFPFIKRELKAEYNDKENPWGIKD